VFGLIIAWALSACASGLKQRLEPETTHNSNYLSIHHMNDKEKAAVVYETRVQRKLCSVGAVCSKGGSSVALWSTVDAGKVETAPIMIGHA
jgi:hypothetical protein